VRGKNISIPFGILYPNGVREKVKKDQVLAYDL